MRLNARSEIFGLAAAVLTAGLLLAGPVIAQQAPAPSRNPAPKANVAMPDAERIVLLIRSTLLTLNDALQTGNFTVLRDRSAPGFRDANSAARLSAIFSDLSRRGIDLTPVAVLAPELAEPPGLDQQAGMLRLKGHFPGQPVRIDFELLFQSVAGRWRIFGIAVQPVQVAAAAPAAATPAAKTAVPAAAKPAAPAAAPAKSKK